jgi:hypothetical protein
VLPQSSECSHPNLSIAQYNKAKILANTKRGRRAMVANNKIPGMNRLYGYTYDKELHTLVENPKEKEGYLIMIKMILKGETCSAIARYLSVNNYCAPKGDKWYEATISRILNNETYKGIYYYGKTEVMQVNGEKIQVPKPRDEWKEITIPQFIDDSTFEKVRKCLEGNIKQSGRPSEGYLLKGVVRCGRCGAAVSGGVASVTQSGTHRYYTCTLKTRKAYTVGTGESNKVCLGRNWRTDIIDSIVWNELSKLIVNPEILIDKLLERLSDKSKIDEMVTRRTSITKEITEKEKSKERYIDLYANGFIKSKEELSSKLQLIEINLEQLKQELSAFNENLHLDREQNDNMPLELTVVEKYRKIINNELKMVDMRKIVGIIVDKIVLYDHKYIEIFYNFTSKSNLIRSESYISDSVNFDKLKWVVESPPPKWENIEYLYPEMLNMYNEDLLSFEQIAEATKTDWWTIKQMFKAKEAVLLSTKERGVKRRARDFEWINKLHYEDGIAFTKIYKEHGLSPTYCKQVLEENMYKLKK